MKLRFASWRFPVVLALLLAALWVYYPPHFGGDVVEYTVDTVALAAHRTPDITIEDLGRAKPLLPPQFADVYDQLANDMRAGRDKLNLAFIRGREGKVYSIHFFGYSLLAALPFKVLEKLHHPSLRAFVLVNLTSVFVLGLALRRFFGSELKALAGVGLFMLCGGWLYFDWTSPECVSAAGLLAGLLFFSSGAPVAGAVLAGLAAQQNPTILFFFGFAPLLLVLQQYRAGTPLPAALRSVLGKRNLAALAAGVCLFALPVLFNLYQYGVPNIIARLFSDSRLVGLVRLESFFFDLNQGMILAVPAVALALLAWGWGQARQAKANGLLLGACALFTLALALPALAVLNWNSGAAGVMRYAFWAAMPFLFALLLRLQLHARWPVAPVVLVAAAQYGCMLHAASYEYVEFSPLARFVLRQAPALYHPEPEIFAERVGHNDNYIERGKVYAIKTNGAALKTLVNAANHDADTALCGENGALAPDNSYTDSDRGWRYIDGPVRCMDAALARQRFGAGQFAAQDSIRLAAGWSDVEHNGGAWDGAWSVGSRSRVEVTLAGGLHPATLGLTGNYLDGNKRTRVTVNGIDLGWHVLDQEGPLALPPQAQQGRLTIELEHEAPHSPGPADKRELAFFLHEVSVRGAPATLARVP